MRLIPCRLIQGIFQQLFPCLQALYTAESSHKAPTVQAGFQQFYPVKAAFQAAASIHAAPYNSSQDNPKTTCPRTIQGYNSFPEHSPKTTRSRNTGQNSLLRQFLPGQHRAGLSKIIRPKTYQQDIWCFRTISPRTGIITQLVPRHINKIYGVPRQQDNRSQDRNHYIRKGLSIVCPCNTKVSVFQNTY